MKPVDVFESGDTAECFIASFFTYKVASFCLNLCLRFFFSLFLLLFLWLLMDFAPAVSGVLSLSSIVCAADCRSFLFWRWSSLRLPSSRRRAEFEAPFECVALFRKYRRLWWLISDCRCSKSAFMMACCSAAAKELDGEWCCCSSKAKVEQAAILRSISMICRWWNVSSLSMRVADENCYHIIILDHSVIEECARSWSWRCCCRVEPQIIYDMFMVALCARSIRCQPMSKNGSNLNFPFNELKAILSDSAVGCTKIQKFKFLDRWIKRFRLPSSPACFQRFQWKTRK